MEAAIYRSSVIKSGVILTPPLKPSDPAQPRITNRVIVIKQVSVREYDPGKSLETQELLLSPIVQPQCQEDHASSFNQASPGFTSPLLGPPHMKNRITAEKKTVCRATRREFILAGNQSKCSCFIKSEIYTLFYSLDKMKVISSSLALTNETEHGESRCALLEFILRTVIFSSFLTSEPQSFLQMCRGKRRC